MKPFGTLFFFGLLLAFLAAPPAIAQTHTPRYVSMASRTKAYYEYLPEGYSASGTATYPLLLFITGIGEFGDGSPAQLPYVLKNGPPKLIQAGTFPKSFVVNGQTHRFIVITPQFIKSPRATADDVEAVISYVIAHYKVNTSRIYISGLSYGGGLTWGFPGNNPSYARRVAAIVPVAGATPDGGDSTIYARSRIIAAGNVPVWAFHNLGDPSAPVAATNTYIANINQAPAPTPLARKTIFNASGHDAWTKAYDPAYKEANLNLYQWMLQYQRPAEKLIQVNVYGGTNPLNSSAWNNWSTGTAAASNSSSTGFKYANGSPSTVTAVLSTTSGSSDNGSAYRSGMAPAPVLRYASYATSVRTLTLKGLSATKTYNLQLYASRSSSTAGSTVFTINGVSKTVNAVNNFTASASFTGLVPGSTGQIVVSISKTGTYSYLNGFTLTEAGSAAATVKTSPVQTVLSVTPATASDVEEAITLYPNPAANAVFLSMKNTYRGPVQAQLFDAQGRLQKTVRFVKSSLQQQAPLAVGDMPRGVYFITVQTGAACRVLRLIKQ